MAGETRSSAAAPVWFIDVGDIAAGGTNRLQLTRAVGLIEAITASGITVGAGRTKLRIAMPILSIAGGGMGPHQGEVLAGLPSSPLRRRPPTRRRHRFGHSQRVSVQRRTTRQTRTQPVAPHQQTPPPGTPARRAGQPGHLALFLGAGVSVPAGLPTWTRLLDELAASGGFDTTDLRQLPLLDQAQLLSLRMPTTWGQQIAKITSRAKRPSLARPTGRARLPGSGHHELRPPLREGRPGQRPTHHQRSASGGTLHRLTHGSSRCTETSRDPGRSCSRAKTSSGRARPRTPGRRARWLPRACS